MSLRLSLKAGECLERNIEMAGSGILAGALVVVTLCGLWATTPARATELVDAARSGDIVKVKALLDAYAEVNATDQYGTTALVMASATGHLDVVRALLAAKAPLGRTTFVATPLV